jgi:hypothetical protein
MIPLPLAYAELGYAVFPCVPGGKRPLTEHGLKDATNDADQISAWLAQHPSANWAIATDGLLVVDVDRGAEHWPEDEQKAKDLAAAAVIGLTPNGRHFFFRAPGAFRNSQSRLAEKVDTRGNGGYVVVAPSTVNGKAYRWASGSLDVGPEGLTLPPQWIIDALAEPPAKAPAAVAGDSGTIAEGRRNATLTSLAGAMRRLGAPEAELLAAIRLANQQRCRPPLEESELATIAKSVASYAPADVSTYLAQQAAEADLPADTSPADPGALPAHLINVPGFVNDVIAYNLAGAFRPQPVLALAGALCLLATLTGRKVTDSQGTRTNLYALGVAGTSTGKERAREVNKELLHAAGLEAMIGPESIGSAPGLVNAVDANPAILFQLDEFGRYLKTMGNASEAYLYNIVSVLMRLFTSSASIYVGDAVVDAKRIKTIYQPHACLYGTTTPDVLYNALNADSISDGFLSRVLIFEGDDEAQRQRFDKPPLPQALIEQVAYWGNFAPGGNLACRTPQPIIVETTAAARRIIGELEAFADAEQQRIGAPLGLLWPRAVEKAGKLALLYACSENPAQPLVGDAAATWAVDIVTHLTQRLAYLAGRWLAENRQERGIKRIARIIEDAGAACIAKTALLKATKWLTRRERDEFLQTLIESGEVVMRQVETLGRPRTMYCHRGFCA